MMVDRLVNYTPDGKLTVFKRLQIRAIRWTKWTAGSHAARFCVSGRVRGSTVLLQWPLN